MDHRLRQQDFADDDGNHMRPWLGCSIEDVENAKAILLIGSNIRKEQPLLGLRVRKAVRKGARAMAINALDYDFNFELSHKIVTPPSRLPHELAAVLRSVDPDSHAGGARSDSRPSDGAQSIGRVLQEAGGDAVLILGNGAGSHASASVLRALTQNLAEATGAAWGCLSEGNGVAGWIAGCVPHRTNAGQPLQGAGRNALDMVRDPLRGYLLLGAEPSVDCIDGHAASVAMANADSVVALTAFDVREHSRADVLLPITPYSETAGTYVNCEGRTQSVTAAVAPKGEARPAWKVLRVLGNLFEVDGFDYVTSEEVRDAVGWQGLSDTDTAQVLTPNLTKVMTRSDTELELIGDVPLYRVDGLVRRASALQATRDNLPPAAFLGPEEAQRKGVEEGDEVVVRGGDNEIRLPVKIDQRVTEGCVYIPGGYDRTAPLGISPTVSVVKG